MKVIINIFTHLWDFVTHMLEQFVTPIKKLWTVFSDPVTLSVTAGLGILAQKIQLAFVRDHIISWDLVTAVVSLLMVDTFLGVWKHHKLGTLNSKGFGSFMAKVVIYWLFIKTADHIARVKLLEWSGDILISGLLVREGISIFENMGVIYPGIVPPWILKKLRDFDDDGKVNDSSQDPSQSNGGQG